MEGKSKFLPDSVSGALRNIAHRAAGGAMMLVGLYAAFALIFHNPYLDGFATASSFGNQSIVGNIVGWVRYFVGFVPAMFLFLYLARSGLAMMARWDDDEGAPEYNLLRGFIALCMGAAGFGMIAPMSTYGGLAGVLAASDVSAMIGGWSVLVGILCLGVFFIIGGILLHIKLAHVRAVAHTSWRITYWLMSVFHLTRGMSRPVEDVEEDDETDDEEYEEEEDEMDDEAPRKPTRARKTAARKPRSAHTDAADIHWELPDPRFMEKSVLGKGVVTPEMKQNATALETHFAEYGVDIKVTGIRPGPIVTLYETELAAGQRQADMDKTSRDMKRAMATSTIRIAPMPGTKFIGVELGNIKPQTVRFRSMIDNPLFTESKYKIPLALGVDIGGHPMYFDLAKMPHVLIAGRTGSGKSVFVQSIIMSIVYHFTPDKCKLMIIDPKGVDFNLWDDVPHLITPVVKLDAHLAVNALKWSVNEMEERYKRLQMLGVQNIEGYNEAVAKKRAAGEVLTRQVAVGTDPETGALEYETQEVDLSDMPYLVIIIDEVADLMTVERKEVEMCVMRLAAKARASGIHLVMATQRPDAQTITGVIKANFPTRISFQARSMIDSMTTLGQKGAEQLLACGDMLFSEAGKEPVRIHGAFIENTEVNKVADFLRAQGEPEFAFNAMEADSASGIPGAIPGLSGGGSKDDDMYAQAKEVVLRDKKTSISYVQRRLKIGYNRAASLIERMEQDGILSPADGTGKRQILV